MLGPPLPTTSPPFVVLYAVFHGVENRGLHFGFICLRSTRLLGMAIPSYPGLTRPNQGQPGLTTSTNKDLKPSATWVDHGCCDFPSGWTWDVGLRWSSTTAPACLSCAPWRKNIKLRRIMGWRCWQLNPCITLAKCSEMPRILIVMHT